MTEPNDLHLDDELLSAVLDGEAAIEQSAHADVCEPCRARLQALRDASVLVAAPVPSADGARRDAAIDAALAAMDDWGASVVPLRRRRTPPAWLAAAAAVVVAVGAISLLARDSDEDTSGLDAATGGGADSGQTETMMADEEASSALAFGAPVDGGDLGAIDPASLRQTIDETFGTARGSATGLAEDDAFAEQGPPPVPCEQEVRDGNADLGPLVYRASGTLDGAPVLVLAFEVPPDRWVYVVTADGCAIRNQQTYSP